MNAKAPATEALNVVHCKDFLANALPPKCANLIIADPPYFEVKGDFDFIWESFEAYLADVERWAAECKRLLADSGTLFWWGMDKKIAYSQIILDRYFSLINTLVWERPGLLSEWDTRRTFPERGMERLLMYGFDYEPNEWNKTGLEKIYSNPDCFGPIKAYMRQERDKLMAARGLENISQFNDFINEWTGTKSVASRHYFADSQYAFPTEVIYRRMQETGFWQRPYWTEKTSEGLRNEYEELRNEYEGLRRPFNNYLKLTDVLKFPQDAYTNGAQDHDTPKPRKLTRALILTCSRPGDLVVVPFAGSGTECAMAAQEGRRFVGFEIDKKHADAANAWASKAASEHRAKPQLFTPEQQYTFKQAEIFDAETLEK